MKILKQWFTERDNQTFCIVRALLSAGALVMLYRFAWYGGGYMEFAGGLASIGSAIALKNQTEKV